MMAHGAGAADWGDKKDNAIQWSLLGRILAYARPYRKLIVFTFLLAYKMNRALELITVRVALGVLASSLGALLLVATLVS